jgi:IS30 family transposase
MADHLVVHGELQMNAEVRRQLGMISVSSLRRRLPASKCAFQRIAHRKGLPRPSFAEKHTIPMRRIDWEECQPGHFEVDLVHHCGVSADEQYAHTLQLLDVAPGWSKCIAVLEHSYLVMQDGLEHNTQRLPFAIREIHPDNGAELLNTHLVRY